ncbi:MAG: thiamine pyrophosphate-dependent enzyme, partial [Myxococcota bacterium]
VIAVAQALRSAKRPVLVMGNQAMVNLSPSDAAELAKDVGRLGVPTFLGGSSRGLLGTEHPIWFRHKRSKALREADFVLIAGFPFDFRLGYGLKINRDAHLVSVNLDKGALTKNRRPTRGVLAHPGVFLRQLVAHGTAGPIEPWIAQLRAREEARDAEIAGGARTDGPLVDPVHFFQRVEAQLDDDSILIVDGGDFVATGSYIVRPRKPLSWLDPGVFGTLGVGGGFALGAHVARPDAEVWLFYGDGSSAYSIAELDTCLRSGFAPICVIGNDASWQQIARDQVKLLGDPVGTVLRRTDYHRVAEGYGAKGLLLDRADAVDDVIQEAKATAKAGTPVCINVHLASSDFREGSMSI